MQRSRWVQRARCSGQLSGAQERCEGETCPDAAGRAPCSACSCASASQNRMQNAGRSEAPPDELVLATAPQPPAWRRRPGRHYREKDWLSGQQGLRVQQAGSAGCFDRRGFAGAASSAEQETPEQDSRRSAGSAASSVRGGVGLSIAALSSWSQLVALESDNEL